jgi:hypothetical protein
MDDGGKDGWDAEYIDDELYIIAKLKRPKIDYQFLQ